jgi:EmrB/QacA subfamily drug resistance transporter
MRINQAASQTQTTAKWWVLFAIGIGTFMAALDGSVVNTVLPVISSFFETDIAHIQWVVIVYMLVLSGLLLSFGRLGDMRGHKRVYVLGFGVFVAASALCGLAPNATALIGFRGLQALGAAMLSANSPAILTKTFPAEQRGQALGLLATMTYLGLTVGPSLGGWLAFSFSWRWIFYINVPVGVVAILLSLRYIPNDKGSNSRERFDIAGSSVFIIGLVALLLGLNQGYLWGWFSTPILALLGGAAAFLGFFIYLQRTVPHPMLDLSLFRVRLFSVSVFSAVINYICIFSVIFLLPFYLIQGRGFSTAEAGLLLTAQPIIMALVAPVSGSLSDKIGAHLLTILGMLILGTGLVFMSFLGPDSSHQQIITGLAWVGLGTGIFISPNNSALMGSAPRARQGIAAGILATARNAGMALGVGISGAIFTTMLARGEAAGITGALYSAYSSSFLAAAGIALFGVLIMLKR